jgi:hypothetical protein
LNVGRPPVCRKASPGAMAAATATLRERATTHLLAAITAYQLNPIKKDIKLNMINA